MNSNNKIVQIEKSAIGLEGAILYMETAVDGFRVMTTESSKTFELPVPYEAEHLYSSYIVFWQIILAHMWSNNASVVSATFLLRQKVSDDLLKMGYCIV